MNSLCIAFDYCSLNGFHTCRFRFGQPTLSTITTQCGFYKITANKDCPDGVFIRSQGICKNMTILPGLALLKPTQRSSTYRFYTAGYAVDGINGTDMAIDKCSSTDGGDTNPWWMVGLHTVYSITSVKIFNRGLEQGGIPVPDRLRNVTVTVGLTESTVNTFCGCYVGPGTLSQVVIIDCPTLPQGRFVKVSKTTEHLTLCEVDVFGVTV
nr:fucolectin-like [Crassostrea gigas]